MTEMTERQAKAWPEAVAEAQRYAETTPEEIQRWSAVQWAEELRPGRGQDLDALWLDGEHLVQIRMDVYGRSAVSVGETDWLHSSADEECGCEHCEDERERDGYERLKERLAPGLSALARARSNPGMPEGSPR